MGSDLALRCSFICYVKPNPLLARQRQPKKIALRASDWLAPSMTLASTSFANPAFSYLAVVLVSALMGVQTPEGEKTEISLL
jgi:hypothetical protein